jgi:hypothetical protein
VCCGAGVSRQAGVFPRFVPEENYAGNFGFQWNRFRRTQLDSHTRVPDYRQTVLRPGGARPRELSGLTCSMPAAAPAGSRRSCSRPGPRSIGVDYSTAIEAAAANLSGSLASIPLQAGSLSTALRAGAASIWCTASACCSTRRTCIGAFRALVDQVAPGGRLVVDVYRRWWRNRVHPKYLLRPMTTRMDQQRLFGVIERCDSGRCSA